MILIFYRKYKNGNNKLKTVRIKAKKNKQKKIWKNIPAFAYSGVK
jgi:hypothetical protein